VKVLDFGVSISEDHAHDSDIAGTLTYMTPEVLQGDAASPQSDLYSVGVMAYEIFAGHHPFASADSTGLIAQIIFETPNFSILDAPVDIVEVLEKLLSKTPGGRYDSADDVIEALCRATARTVPPESEAIRESFLQAAKFVGRDSELSQLASAFAHTLEHQGSAWLISGESGVGKSRLLDELRTLALVEGALVLRGHEVSEPGIPFQMWGSVVRWLALVTDLNDLEISRLSLLFPDIPAIVGRRVGDLEVSDLDLDPQGVQDHLMSVIEDVFHRQQQSLVVILEDLHWASSESLILLHRLSRIVSSLPLLLVASYRDDERPDLPDHLPDIKLLRLERLSADHIGELSEAMLGSAGKQAQVVELLHKETEGNVFFVVEVVRALAEEAGRLDNIATMALPQQVFAGGVTQLIQRRLSRIPEQGHELLQLAAVAGRQIDLKVMRFVRASTAILMEKSVEIEDWLTTCANFAVLEVIDGQWRFVHDKLRDGLLADLDDAQLRHLHLSVATAIEEAYPGASHKLVALAYHWGKAGDTDRESHYTALAGKQALNSTAFREAIGLLERAVELQSRAAKVLTGGDKRDTAQVLDARSRQRLAYLIDDLGEAYFGLGEYNHAKELYERSQSIFESINDKLGIARAQADLGEVAYALGDYQEAERLLKESLRLSEQVGDRIGSARIRRELGEVFYARGDYREAQRLIHQSLTICREIGDKLGIAHALAELGNLANDTGNYADARKLSLESVTLSQELGDRRSTAEALNNLGSIAEALGEFDEAKHHYGQCYAICTEIGDRSGIALSLARLGNVSVIQKDYPEATDYYTQARDLFQKIGDQWGVAHALNGLGTVSRSQHRLVEARRLYEESLSIFYDIGDKRGMASSFNWLGDVFRETGNYDDAWAQYKQALRLAMDIRAMPLVLDILDGVAALLVRNGELERALQLLLTTLEHPAMEKLNQNEAGSLMALLESELSQEAIDAARTRSLGVKVETIVRQLVG
jgi:predicted ATPase